jgi:hypothetical protein
MPASRKDFEDQETCADLRGDHLAQVEIMVRMHHIHRVLTLLTTHHDTNIPL